MTANDTLRHESGMPADAVSGAARSLLGRFARQFADSKISFDVNLPDGSVQHFGPSAPSFSVFLRNSRALRAIASIDEGRFAGAYLTGDIDLEGDLMSMLALRGSMKDLHPLTTAWRFIQPLLFGQVRTNQQAITAHYDMDPEFFLSFLDPKTPCYTQGIYLSPDESLEAATLRKLEDCYAKCELKPGDHILEIGPGWGAWFEFASRRGVKCTGISISQMSIDYLNRRAAELGFDWELVFSDLLEYRTERKYDGIVIMGVMEHLPDYRAVLEKFAALIKPGRRIFIDASAATVKYELSSFMVKYIFGGNHSFLVLHDLLDKVAKSPFEPIEIHSDRISYGLTFRQWARNLERNREHVVQHWGEFNYRRFRLYLWGGAYEMFARNLDCYRIVLEAAGRPGAV